MADSNGNTGFLQAADGTRLFYREWRHPQPRGSVVLVHGLGEHSGRYEKLTEIFHAAGFSTRIHDHRGHGRSEGQRGSLRAHDDLLTDLKLVFDDFAVTQNGAPFLFGHSLGGLVAARFATAGMSRVRGLLLSSPALAIRLTRCQKALLALTTAFVPWLAVPTGFSAGKLSHDPDAVQAYQDDALNHNRVAARLVNFMLDAMRQVQRDAGTFTLPLLLQYAGDDAFVDPDGSRRFFASVPQVDKTRHCYDQACHEIFHETQQWRLQAQHDLASWLELHQPAPSGGPEQLFRYT